MIVEVVDPFDTMETTAGLNDTVNPGDDTRATKDTVPLELVRLLRLSVEVAEDPLLNETEVGLADNPKSKRDVSMRAACMKSKLTVLFHPSAGPN